MVIKNHLVETTVKPDKPAVFKGHFRKSIDTSFKAPFVGENVGPSILEGVKRSDALGYPKVGAFARFLEGDVGIGTAVINVAK